MFCIKAIYNIIAKKSISPLALPHLLRYIFGGFGVFGPLSAANFDFAISYRLYQKPPLIIIGFIIKSLNYSVYYKPLILPPFRTKTSLINYNGVIHHFGDGQDA